MCRVLEHGWIVNERPTSPAGRMSSSEVKKSRVRDSTVRILSRTFTHRKLITNLINKPCIPIRTCVNTQLAVWWSGLIIDSAEVVITGRALNVKQAVNGTLPIGQSSWSERDANY
ncbi:hypothetical protein J6590_018913 [Homalodisca vitripennis]|nr:hypothetical protein J6590_018913 [Homalodisca vitripennis]